MFNHLFWALRLHHPSMANNTAEARHLAKQLWFRNTYEHHKLNKSQLEKFLVDPTWTKATFFREPASRFLSAFRSKCDTAHDRDGRKHCRRSFGKNVVDGSVHSFHQAIFKLSNHTEKVFGDAHFAPASRFCGGLDSTLPYYDVVHQLDKQSAPRHVETLFRRIGVDPNLSQSLIESAVQTGGAVQERDIQNIKALMGQTLRGAKSMQAHHTGSAQGTTQQTYFGTDDTWLRIIHERYQMDYNLFQLEGPTLL